MKLNQVTVSVTELARSIAFYQGLGLQLIVRDEEAGYARFVCPDGDATFSLHVQKTPIVPGSTLVYFECDALDEVVRGLVAAGYVFTSMPVDQPWLWREATLDDPDGNHVCLYFAGKNRLDPPWRLGAP